MPTVSKKQLAVRLPLPMAAAAQELAWKVDRDRGTAESSGYMQRWLEGLIHAELSAWGYWPPSAKTWAGNAPRSPHTGRPSDAAREARTEAKIERALEHERLANGGLTEREAHEARARLGMDTEQLPPARTREEADTDDVREPEPRETPADEARGDEVSTDPLTDDDGNIL